jgi:putative transposase
VGLDAGLTTFATLSDGVEIENPRFFRQSEKALAKAQRKLSKTAKPAKGEKASPERCRARKVVAHTHERTKFKRQNFTHQESRKIINRNGLVAVEDLRINHMNKNHRLAKSIMDAAWSSFFEQLCAKAGEAGRTFVKVNPAYTSQTCSRCGQRASTPCRK